MAEDTYPPEVQAIVSNVKEWLESRNNTIELELTADTPLDGLVEQDFPGAAQHGPTFTQYSKSSQTYFSISFSKKVLPLTTVDELRNTFKFVALDKLPLPDFEYPLGWDIFPQTPISSFGEGVEIISYENGRLHFKIDTRFYCMYGNIPTKQPGCGPSPRGTYFEVEQDIHGLIDVNMPLQFL